MYPERLRGREPVAPAVLAMVTLLQAALGMSDEEAVEYAAFERRWQMLCKRCANSTRQERRPHLTMGHAKALHAIPA